MNTAILGCGIPTVTLSDKMMFEKRACTSLTLVASAKLAVLKSDYQLRFCYRLNNAVPAPFSGQVYHCPHIFDPFREQGKSPLENGTYVDTLLCGGLNSKSFTGIRTGETPRTECDQVVKKQIFMEVYFHLTLTANHGSHVKS